MKRQDLEEKKIGRLESMEQAMKLINLLNYDECIAVLNSVKGMSSTMYKAIMERAKSLNGITYELVVAGIQAAVN